MLTPEHDGFPGPTRRAVLKGLTALGAGSLTFRRALAAQAAQAGTVTPEMIKQAEWIAGLELTEDERTRTARRFNEPFSRSPSYGRSTSDTTYPLP